MRGQVRDLGRINKQADPDILHRVVKSMEPRVV